MKKSICILFIAALSVIGFAQGENAALRNEIQKFYHRFDELVAKNDTAGILRMMHPNFVSTDVKGNRTTYADMKAMMNGFKSNVKDFKSKITVVHVGGDMKEATAWVSMTTEYSQKTAKGWTRMKQTSRFAETIVQTSTGWRFIYSQQLPTDEPWPF